MKAYIPLVHVIDKSYTLSLSLSEIDCAEFSQLRLLLSLLLLLVIINNHSIIKQLFGYKRKTKE